MATGVLSEGAPSLRMGSPAGRWALLATVLGTGMAFLDGTVINIALPTIGRDLDAGFAGLQWMVNAYTLTLAGFLLLGGSLGDHFGRRRVFVIGVAWFAVGSLLCGIAPTEGTLIAARALQGIGGALLTPGSLAIIEASFAREDRGAAVGAWSGLSGVAAALGPLVGGWLVDAGSWRLIFLMNLPLAAVVIWVALRHVPETSRPQARGTPLDLVGAALTALGLAGVTYALTEAPTRGFGSASVLVLGLLGVAALAAFVLHERATRHPMVPLDIFASLQFSAANVVTFLVYAALSGALFLLPIQLQAVSGYSPLAAGSALIPLTAIMLALSSRVGRLASQIGPRPLMTVGPIVAGLGLIMMARIDGDGDYLTQVLPAVLVMGFGMTLTVAPLTSAVLTAGGEEHAGISSAINNDVARVAGLLAVAIIPLAVGLSGGDYERPAVFDDAFQMGVVISGGLAIAGGLLAFATIRRIPGPAPGGEEASHCPLSAPPLRAPEFWDERLAVLRDQAEREERSGDARGSRN